MSWIETLQLATVIAALVGPLLVYSSARARLSHDRNKSRDESTWERMAVLVDKYGKRAQDLEVRVEAAEARAVALSHEVGCLRVQLNQWRAFAQALFHQVLDESIRPVNPADYGILDWDK